jgi:A/G-specific adenine glycosylase
MLWKEESARPLTQALFRWAEVNGRRFPWRDTTDPFRILIAETLLHRTRASSVLPVYKRLIRVCPSPAALLRNEKIVLEIVQPLGLRWRAKALVRAVELIQEKHGGRVPLSREELLALPGVSEYIAGAVLCFSTDSWQILLDANIVRVTGRVRGLATTDASRRSQKFRVLVSELLRKDAPRKSYFALLDLAALVCKPVNPLCAACPINRWCAYFAKANPGIHGNAGENAYTQ